MSGKQKKLFCEINPFCYAISLQKEICKRHVKNMMGTHHFAKQVQKEPLPNLVAEFSSNLIKRGKGIDIRLQENKAKNIEIAGGKINGLVIHPGEEFSFWKTVGKITKRKGYLDGRVIKGNQLTAGLGGGLCNLGNTIHRVVLHSPLTVTEFHSHSSALAPETGERVPFSSGTSISYNYIDYRFQNQTDQDVQLLVWCADERLYVQLRSEKEFPASYELVEEDHHYKKKGEKYYSISRIYKKTIDRKSGEVIAKDLVWDDCSEVMYDYSDIPQSKIRE